MSALQPSSVKNLFTSIAKRYELANHLLCGGMDVWWRAVAARSVASWAPKRLLDIATGNGDLAVAIKKKSPSTQIIGADFCHAMLLEAAKKNIPWLVEADGLSLPFANESFDAVTIAFGLRNMASWETGLHEMERVLCPGGHLLILDFSLPKVLLLLPLYRFYLHKILPSVAGWVTGQPEAYSYMGTSIEQFPSGKAMEILLEQSGFCETKSQPLTLGVVSIYHAKKRI
ncbi:MAG: methyltransferase [Verrucomicrobia bacterium RIFCSPHIGHO2_12_FULL_41_10]|nr:MAG: methyltransferase [Verrucomicrobia bacterium RIFCSPHIGHO2_12_FULL_41_10]